MSHDKILQKLSAEIEDTRIVRIGYFQFNALVQCLFDNKTQPRATEALAACQKAVRDGDMIELEIAPALYPVLLEATVNFLVSQIWFEADLDYACTLDEKRG